MFSTLKTLIAGANARADEKLREAYSVELIDQKMRESQAALAAAKLALAGMVQRERAETRALDDLTTRTADLTARATQALAAGREDLATEAAEAIAALENEAALRRTTRERLEARILRLRASVEAGHRRLTDLKQGAIAARAAVREAREQARLGRALGGADPMAEAETLIQGVLGRDDPFEAGEILRDIDRGLDRSDVADRLAEAGFGRATRTTASDVLARLRAGN